MSVIRTTVVALVGLVAGWVAVPSFIFGLLFTIDGFGGEPTLAALVGYGALCLALPFLTLGLASWLNRIVTGLVASASAWRRPSW